MEKLVIVPTYNERENIGPLLDQLMALPERVDVLVVDDASPDGTGDLVRERAVGEPRIHLLQRAGKLGLGSAYV
jgi:dolichol-phosphate mannosyltransferase